MKDGTNQGDPILTEKANSWSTASSSRVNKSTFYKRHPPLHCLLSAYSLLNFANKHEQLVFSQPLLIYLLVHRCENKGGHQTLLFG